MEKKCFNTKCGLYDAGWVHNCKKLVNMVALEDCDIYQPTERPSYVFSFNDIVTTRCDRIRAVLQHKAKEYASGADRFHNFNVAARITGETPEKALLGMMMKHIVSILDLIDKPSMRTPELIDEKVGDGINYLILLEGMMLKGLSK